MFLKSGKNVKYVFSNSVWRNYLLASQWGRRWYFVVVWSRRRVTTSSLKTWRRGYSAATGSSSGGYVASRTATVPFTPY